MSGLKLAAISDTHFGDPKCALLDRHGETWKTSARCDELLKKVAGCDYLVLMGDILDFSIVSYKEAYEAASVFFKAMVAVPEENRVKQIIYLPGNHDFGIWHTVEHEVNVIRRLRGDDGKPKLPRSFRWTVPGVIDDRHGEGRLDLVGVTARQKPDGADYGGLFLDGLTDGKIPFNVAYPNLYIIDRAGNCALLTHGHYFDKAWSYLGACGIDVLGPTVSDIKLKRGTMVDMKTYIPAISDFVAMNFPVNQLLCSGFGMAGPLTAGIRDIQRLAKDIATYEKAGLSYDEGIKSFKGYLERIDRELLDPLVESFWWEGLSDTGIGLLKKKVLDKVRDYRSARGDEAYLLNEETKANVIYYLHACLGEIREIKPKLKNAPDVMFPTRLIYGHTHDPVPYQTEKNAQLDFNDYQVEYANTGSFLKSPEPDDPENFKGAEVMLYDSENGFTSKTIV